MKWTETEIEILKAEYSTRGVRCLPYRSQQSVTSKANNLNIKVIEGFEKGEPLCNYEVQQIELANKVKDLIKRRAKLIREVTKALKVSEPTMRYHSTKSYTKNRTKWSDEEVSQLRNNYSTLGRNSVPTRTKAAVSRMARLLGISTSVRRYTLGEIEIIKKDYPIMGVKCLPSRSRNSVHKKAISLGIKYTG